MGKKESKTKKALRLLRENPGLTAYAVCKELDLAQSVLSRARAVERQKRALFEASGLTPDGALQ